MIFDPIYLIMMAPTIILMLWAQRRVKSTFQKYSQVPNQQRMSGAEVARVILDSHGLHDVPVEPVAGELTDHYDPRVRALRLSQPVYNSRSVAALGIAAHESGHALQHAQAYFPLQVRGALVPVASIGSNLGWIMVLAGLVIGLTQLAWLGVILFAAGTVFALITLPVEFNASSRALAELSNMGIVDSTEMAQNKTVLNAAAWTYIAGFAAAAMQLLYYIMLVSGMRRD
ncbi:MAG: zinc metallopeptidase [Chloroflexia bacterium]|jgi:Zn-dependent membrane protease YugP|nr:zinc metallopeptidase [Chloroflexia bacterium]